jgi:putative ABC transport system substrate-binding protein
MSGGLRLFIALVLLASAPASAWAQVPVVGRLGLGSPESDAPALNRLRQELKELGHQDGRTFVLEPRYARGDNSRFPALARELLARRPAVITGPCGPALRAIRDISRSVPVVAGCADPKNFLGEIASLGRPGGQTTGFTFLAPESVGKRLQLLKELLPRLSRVGVLHNRHDDWGTYWQEMDRVGPQLGVTFSKAVVERAENLEQAFAAVLRQRAEALIVFPDAITFGARERIAALAVKHQLPTAFDTRRFVVDGGLLSYGPDWVEFGPRVAAAYIDKILKGATPGDLPVQQPTRLELVINLRTARALGLDVPRSLLARADEVLQ